MEKGNIQALHAGDKEILVEIRLRNDKSRQKKRRPVGKQHLLEREPLHFENADMKEIEIKNRFEYQNNSEGPGRIAAFLF
ncbi:hypothetical protein [Megasphaera sp.]|uniref:hypothetical protein n=1 Tax=Megasphaera sp. TaxID=2023260 RepID=UPI003078E612